MLGLRHARLERRSRWLGWLRVALFLAGALLLVGLLDPGVTAPGALLAALALVLVLFTLAVAVHARVRAVERLLLGRMALCEDGERRIARDWDALPSVAPLTPLAGHPYAEDLDLFGRASLFRLLPATSTVPGRETLERWLLAPAAAGEVRERQGAVRELAPMTALREELALLGRRVFLGRADVARFLAWAEGQEPALDRRWVPWAAAGIPLATAALVVAAALGAAPVTLWLLPVAAALALRAALARALDGVIGGALASGESMQQYAALARAVGGAPLTAPRLRALQRALGADGAPAHERLAALRRLVELAEVRHSSMLHGALQPLLLWDVHVALGLERWRRRDGRAARGWLAALGEAEALSALATLARENPTWRFPELAAEGEPPRVEATALAHPLLASAARVANDVTVGPRGTFLLVTGSNMSGKSTLLRAIGANVVLAQAGAPVCAAAMRCPTLAVHTVMRVQDSLASGVSLFLAEVQRLKGVVEAARAAARAGGPPVLYLLDEILQGTNSAERQVAARRVIRTLVTEGAIGAVTTHDLALADSPELARAAVPVHFRETVHEGDAGPAMTFDYRLRPGLATSVNALRLMEMMGLGGE